MLARLRGTEGLGRRWWWAVAALLVVTVPLLVSGPGNDLDVANVFRAGRSIARHADYVPSRAPGSPLHEALVGVLDLAGGPFFTNLASLAAAVALLVGLDVLLAGEGLGRQRRWALAVLAVNPWFVVAATSTADYVFALAFLAWSAVAVRAGRPVVAGIAAALAMGCRVGTAALVLAVVVAELVGHDDRGDALSRPARRRGPARRADRSEGQGASAGRRSASDQGRAAAARRLGVFGLVGAAGTVLLFVPSYRHAGGLSFAQNDFATSSPLVQLGRAAAKDLALLGTLGTVLALATVPAVLAALRRWRASWLVRFGVTALVLAQLLFVRFPWKVPHLLPCLVAAVVLWAVALQERPGLRPVLVGLVVLQVVFAVVRVDLVAPDHPDEATGARIRPSVGWGPVVTDWRCRREHPDAYRGRQKVEVEAAWDCAKPFG